jgi:PASTA domain
MSSWLVSSSAQRIELDASGRGTVSFSVANSGAVPEQAVFDVAVGPGADRSWFQLVGEPRMLVHHGAAVEFKVQCWVPPGTAPGSYWLQGVAYTAERRETAALSNAVSFEVGPAAAGAMAMAAQPGQVVATGTGTMPAQAASAPAYAGSAPGYGGPPQAYAGSAPGHNGPTSGHNGPASGHVPAQGQPAAPVAHTTPGSAPTAPKAKPKRRTRLLVAGAVGLVVIIALAAAGFFFLRGNDDQQQGDVAAPPPPPAEVVVPDVTLLPEAQAIAILQVSNLTVGEVIAVQRRNANEGIVINQSVRQGTTVPAGQPIDIAVTRNS